MAKKKGRVASVGGSYPGPDIEDRVFAGLPVDVDPDDPEAIHRGWIDFDAGDTLADLSPRVEASLVEQGVFCAPAQEPTGQADEQGDTGTVGVTEEDVDG
jgi:hypothetical protein